MALTGNNIRLGIDRVEARVETAESVAMVRRETALETLETVATRRKVVNCPQVVGRVVEAVVVNHSKPSS